MKVLVNSKQLGAVQLVLVSIISALLFVSDFFKTSDYLGKSVIFVDIVYVILLALFGQLLFRKNKELAWGLSIGIFSLTALSLVYALVYLKI